MRDLREPSGLHPPAEDYQEIQTGLNFCYEALVMALPQTENFVGSVYPQDLPYWLLLPAIKWIVSYETAWYSSEIGLDGIFHTVLSGNNSGRMADTIALDGVFFNLMAYHLG